MMQQTVTGEVQNDKQILKYTQSTSSSKVKMNSFASNQIKVTPQATGVYRYNVEHFERFCSTHFQMHAILKYLRILFVWSYAIQCSPQFWVVLHDTSRVIWKDPFTVVAHSCKPCVYQQLVPVRVMTYDPCRNLNCNRVYVAGANHTLCHI